VQVTQGSCWLIHVFFLEMFEIFGKVAEEGGGKEGGELVGVWVSPQSSYSDPNGLSHGTVSRISSSRFPQIWLLASSSSGGKLLTFSAPSRLGPLYPVIGSCGCFGNVCIISVQFHQGVG